SGLEDVDLGALAQAGAGALPAELILSIGVAAIASRGSGRRRSGAAPRPPEGLGSDDRADREHRYDSPAQQQFGEAHRNSPDTGLLAR
ncbi:MAG: hypothetical protein ACRDH5_06660, partial [bacterium]